jgi:hypothetical protein
MKPIDGQLLHGALIVHQRIQLGVGYEVTDAMQYVLAVDRNFRFFLGFLGRTTLTFQSFRLQLIEPILRDLRPPESPP